MRRFLEALYNSLTMGEDRSITVTVKLFAIYRERLARSQISLALPATATVASALDELSHSYPQLSPLVHSTMVAVNQEYAPSEQELQEGDEVALIPPVSGGAGQALPPYLPYRTGDQDEDGPKVGTGEVW